jgi:hypothetical protein
MAATSTRSDRDIASLVFMDGLNFFSVFGFAWSIQTSSISLLRPCCPFAASRSHSLFRLRCFDFAIPQKVPNGSSTVAAFAKPPPNRQINFLFGVPQ